MTTTLCPLDADYPIEIDVADSPEFANLLTHWEGISETVTELQGHLYQEVIELTRVEQHVFTFRSDHVEHDTRIHEQVEAYALGTPPPLQPIATFSVAETGPMRAIKIDEPPIFIEDEYFERFDKIDTAWNLEAIKLGRRHWRRTRIFCKMVWAAYKTARSS
jgi:hypothetical protein